MYRIEDSNCMFRMANFLKKKMEDVKWEIGNGLGAKTQLLL